MEFLPVTERQQNAVRDAVADAELVTKFVLRILSRLTSLFNDTLPKEAWGVTIDQLEQETNFVISTPFGRATTELVLAADEGGVFGRILVRKDKKNEKGEIISPVVWLIRVTTEGHVYQGESTSDPISAGPQFRSKSESETVDLGLSLLYAIAAG
ncbi:hypothetical protein C9I50_18205 [Pseudomonas prosekii]|uniref:hypothetical protein n=1 Tax=Pseudomonas prosekii TaxID=1148509 RepID=UPI000D60C6BF|nr:hypothetical protein [Pseudomonas prosekii]PWE39603.1 hypothetical protein C9I50_18205 [Pseudomonas prosekii]